MKKLKNLLVGLSCLSIAIFVWAGTDVETYTVGGTEVWNISNTGSFTAADASVISGTTTIAGAIKFGDSSTSATLPTTANAADFGIKVPVQNATGATIPQGAIVIASAAASGVALAATGAFASSTDVIGVAEQDIAADAVGFMTVAGYALLLTTGTVANGDILVSTDGANGAQAVGFTIVDNTPLAGAAVAKAIGAGTASGGLTPVLVTLH